MSLIGDYFRNRKIKKAQRENLDRLNKEISKMRIAQIRTEIMLLNKRASEDEKRSDKYAYDSAEKADSICPKCSSTKITDRIQRQQGSLEGDFSGSGWNALTFGRSSMSGKIKGSSDTNPVNKCGDCNNEWKKATVRFFSSSARSAIRDKITWVNEYMGKMRDLDNCQFDPMSLEEKFNSLEEKKAALLKELKEDWRVESYVKYLSPYSIDTIEELVKKEYEGYPSLLSKWNEEVLISLGFKRLAGFDKATEITIEK